MCCAFSLQNFLYYGMIKAERGAKALKKMLALVLVVLMLVGIAPRSVAAEEVPIIEDIWEVIDNHSQGYDSTLYLFFYNDTQTLTVSESEWIWDFQKREWDDPDITKPASFKQVGIDQSVRHLVVYDGVKNISNCFNDLYALEDVVLPAGVESISKSFNGCPNLKSVSFTEQPLRIDKDSFRDCPALQSITVADKVYPKAWMDENLVVWEKPTVHYDFDEKTATLTVSGSGTVCGYQPREWDAHVSTDDGNFRFVAEDTTITHLIIKEGITEISNSFNDMISLKTVEFPRSLTSISESFQGCKKIKELTFPEELKAINSYSFNDCAALKEITFQGPIDFFAPNARQIFCNLPALKTVYIPDGSSLQGLIFCHCKNLSLVLFGGPNVTIHQDEGEPFRGCSQQLIYEYESQQETSQETSNIISKDSSSSLPDLHLFIFQLVAVAALAAIIVLIYIKTRKALRKRATHKIDRNPE